MNSPKTILCLLLLAAAGLLLPSVSPAEPTSREYPSLYKSPRAMGMGGAYTAIGGRVDTLFYNPAGLSNIPRDKGWEVNLLNVSAEAGDSTIDFMKGLHDALTTGDLNGDGSTDDDQVKAVNNLLYDYRGQHIHGRVADFTSFGKSFDTLSFGAGALASGTIDAVPHQGFGPEGLLEVNGDETYGAVGGISMQLGPGFFLGASVKSFHRNSVMHDFTARELVDRSSDLKALFYDDLLKKGNAVGFDAGAIWKFAPDSWLRPSVGVSALNVGDLDFGDAGVIPMTFNAGFAVNPRIEAFRSLLLAADYVDFTNQYEQDSDRSKRLRYGAELQLFDTTLLELAVRGGMYEGYPTAGLDLRFSIVTLTYTMYSEEVGAYAGQDRDKRQMVTLVIGW
jgi:hypothetical protein